MNEKQELNVCWVTANKLMSSKKERERQVAMITYIVKQFCVTHSYVPKNLTKNYTALKKCKNKFDCLIYEMFFINELRPSLNVQSEHSICVQVFNHF